LPHSETHLKYQNKITYPTKQIYYHQRDLDTITKRVLCQKKKECMNTTQNVKIKKQILNTFGSQSMNKINYL
jgi:hypothetical protein